MAMGIRWPLIMVKAGCSGRAAGRLGGMEIGGRGWSDGFDGA
jgi:hypothetical protein